jgi:agmatine deiminase
MPGVRQPAEWEAQSTIWTAWPSHSLPWEGQLDPVRKEMRTFIELLGDRAASSASAPTVKVWVDPSGDAALESSAWMLGRAGIQRVEAAFGDIWFRDIGPIFLESSGRLFAAAFRHNGWGGKFLMPHDDTVAARIANERGVPLRQCPLYFEGGGLEVNGEGLALTTRSCLLNANRNPGLEALVAERLLEEHLGISELIWLDAGLQHDHTDGHIDNVARFNGPRSVLCQSASGVNDPQRSQLEAVEQQLRATRLRDGSRLQVQTVPSPGKVTDAAGNPLPASHLNFLITPTSVLVPVFSTPSQDAALEAIQQAFPKHEICPLAANALLCGGGAFHCVTQQEPVVSG